MYTHTHTHTHIGSDASRLFLKVQFLIAHTLNLYVYCLVFRTQTKQIGVEQCGVREGQIEREREAGTQSTHAKSHYI
jgi:hypothetical protein